MQTSRWSPAGMFMALHCPRATRPHRLSSMIPVSLNNRLSFPNLKCWKFRPWVRRSQSIVAPSRGLVAVA